MKQIRVPISYDIEGVSFTLERHAKSLVEMLIPYLGPGALRKAPNPTYPVPQSWSFKHGKGVYELHVDATGKVSEVRVLQSSGDKTFDKTVLKTLQKWEFNRGPLIVEIPLRFSLLPTVSAWMSRGEVAGRVCTGAKQRPKKGKALRARLPNE